MDEPPNKRNYFIAGAILFLVTEICTFIIQFIVNVLPNMMDSGYDSLMLLTILGNTSLLSSILFITFLFPLMILIYFSKKYSFYKEEKVYTKLPIVMLIVFVLPIAVLVGLFSDCKGENCLGAVVFLIGISIYFLFLVVASIIIAHFIKKKIKSAKE